MTNSFKVLHIKQQLDLLRKNKPKDEAFYNDIEKITNDQLENYKDSRKLKFIKANWQFLKESRDHVEDSQSALNRTVVLEPKRLKQSSLKMIFKQKSHVLSFKPQEKEEYSIEDKLRYYRSKAETQETEGDSMEGSKSFLATSNSKQLNMTTSIYLKDTNQGYFPKVKSRKLSDAKSITATLLLAHQKERKNVSIASNLKLKNASQISSSFFTDIKSSSNIRNGNKVQSKKQNESAKRSQGNLHNETNYSLPDRCDTCESIDNSTVEFDRPDLRVNTEGSSFVPVMVYNLDKPANPIKKAVMDPNISEIIKSSLNAVQLKAQINESKSRRSTLSQTPETGDNFRVTNIKFYEPATVEKSIFPLPLIENLPEHKALYGHLKMSKQIHVPRTEEIANFLNKEVLGEQKYDNEDAAREYGIALLRETYRDYLRQKSPSKNTGSKNEGRTDKDPILIFKMMEQNKKHSSNHFLKDSPDLFKDIHKSHYDEEKTVEIYNNRRKHRPHGLGRKYLNASFGVGKDYNHREVSKNEQGVTPPKVESNVSLNVNVKKRRLREYKGS